MRARMRKRKIKECLDGPKNNKKELKKELKTTKRT
jgi:hypothetical protein